MKTLPLNRYRISGLEQPDSIPWCIVVYAATAEDAWFITEKNTKNEYVNVERRDDAGRLRYTHPAPKYAMRTIEAVEP